MTPLGARLVRRIRQDGPITLADYMAACLGDPEHGYYMQREPFGSAGDFTTAPEISQVFGELIGLWAVMVHDAMGAPARFVLAELGPGRGTLMTDALRAAAVRPQFRAAAEIRMIETSPRLRTIQETTLAGSGAKIAWADSIDQLPDRPAIIIANEFFDALPVRQFVRTEREWVERMVGLDGEDGLAFGFRPAPEALPDAPAGAIFETSPASLGIAMQVGERLARHGGAALIIDYGHARPGFGDTLQAVRAHAYADPLAEPGEADLTAHVDFTALAAAAVAAGAATRPVVGQGAFLTALGIAERAGRLARGKDEATQGAIIAAVNRLVAPDAMGDLFKVLALAHPDLVLPVFDGDPA